MYTIAHIENNYTEKFAIPRQSGLVDEVESRIIFEPEFRVAEALRGLEGFSHLWLIWVFSEAKRRGGKDDTQKAGEKSCGINEGEEGDNTWRPTVRPPRLGGNERMGVFATRSPFRPNPIGLSCVEIEKVEENTPEGPVITVKGADLMNGTPILDIKPYIPYADCKPAAVGGFTDETDFKKLEIVIPEEIANRLGEDMTAQIKAVLEQDPRPAYQREQSDRTYTFKFSKYDISFNVRERVLSVTNVKNTV